MLKVLSTRVPGTGVLESGVLSTRVPGTGVLESGVLEHSSAGGLGKRYSSTPVLQYSVPMIEVIDINNTFTVQKMTLWSRK